MKVPPTKMKIKKDVNLKARKLQKYTKNNLFT